MNKDLFILEKKGLNQNSVISYGEEIAYNTDFHQAANLWAKEKIAYIKKKKSHILRIPIDIKPDGVGKTWEGSIGYSANDANNVTHNEKIRIYTLPCNEHGFPFIKENYYETIAYYTVRKCIKQTWNQDFKEYLKPDTSHEEYIQWNHDCIVYSLFLEYACQVSIRNFQLDGKKINVVNQFFWLSNDFMLNLADDCGFNELYQDAIIFKENRFIYQELQTINLSSDAKNILNRASSLLVRSFPERIKIHNLHPEWYLNTWDAGWYQMKLVLQISMRDELSEFVALYKSFEDRMREGVYKFGFLKWFKIYIEKL